MRKFNASGLVDNNHLTHSFFLHIDELENKIEESYEKAIFICISSILPSVVGKNEGGERGDESTYLRLLLFQPGSNAFNTSEIILHWIPTDNGRLRVFLLGVNALH